jgi:chemotaxis protein MotB
MRGKHAHEEHENHERWLVSYADFITLLFAFFVVMFATSQTDKGKAQQVSDSVKKALEGQKMTAMVASLLGGAPDSKGQGNAQMKGPGGDKRVVKDAKKEEQVVELLPSLKLLTKELEEEIRKGRIQITMEARGLTISFQHAALFPSGEDVVAEDAYPSLAKVAAAVAHVPNPIRLEGHTDAVPIHTPRFRSNWELSAARSIALLALMTDRFGLKNDRVSIAGYGDTAPLADNATDQGRARNRRVDVIILNETGLRGEPPHMAKPSGPSH